MSKRRMVALIIGNARANRVVYRALVPESEIQQIENALDNFLRKSFHWFSIAVLLRSVAVLLYKGHETDDATEITTQHQEKQPEELEKFAELAFHRYKSSVSVLNELKSFSQQVNLYIAKYGDELIGTRTLAIDIDNCSFGSVFVAEVSEAPMDAIKTFLKNNVDATLPAESWFHEENFSLYLRTSKNAFQGRGLKAVSLTHINVHQEKRGVGIFTNFLAELEVAVKQAGYDALIVESEKSDRMFAFLQRKGFAIKTMEDGVNDFIKILE
jgi:SOS response regulatory protein OraA/RecX